MYLLNDVNNHIYTFIEVERKSPHVLHPSGKYSNTRKKQDMAHKGFLLLTTTISKISNREVSHFLLRKLNQIFAHCFAYLESSSKFRFRSIHNDTPPITFYLSVYLLNTGLFRLSKYQCNLV